MKINQMINSLKEKGQFEISWLFMGCFFLSIASILVYAYIFLDVILAKIVS